MSNYKIKQVLVVRKDLNMRKGKIAAQCAHASIKILFDLAERKDGDYLVIPLFENDKNHNIKMRPLPLKEWITGSQAKICVSVDSEKELLDVYSRAKEAGLVCSLVTDAGFTEFHGVPTNTVVAIGPDESEKIDKITGSLKLL